MIRDLDLERENNDNIKISMKIKLLILIGMTAVPLLLIAQSGTKPVFFNKGKMSIVGTGSANAVLYVDGDFVADRDANTQTIKSDIYLENSKIVITGDLYQNAAYDDKSGNVEASHIFSLPTTDYANKRSVIEFRGTGEQKIATGLTQFNLASTPRKFISEWKATNYIDFPDILVNNNKHVTIAPEIGATVKNINLTKGRLILDSRRRDDTKDDPATATIHDESTSSLLAHLLVDESGTITYNRSPKTDINDYGAIDVKVAFDAYQVKSDAEERQGGRSIVGMGSPFEQIGGDYFFWNFLMIPYGTNIFGYWNGTVADPNAVLSAGRGFVAGIDLRGTAYSNYGKYHDGSKFNSSEASFNERAKDGYTFGRFAYNNYNNYNPLAGMKSAVQDANNQAPYTSRIVTDPSSAPSYSKENLNYKNVPVKLKAGYNYLANPFTTPLDLSLLIDDSPATGASTGDWGVTKGETSGDIVPYVWILNPTTSKASGLYDDQQNDLTAYPPGMEKLYATYSYLLLRREGATYVSEDANSGLTSPSSIEGNQNIIAPLQMFVIYSFTPESANKNIIIPASQRRITSGANFLRSANTTMDSPDDFLFEVVDKSNNAFDRVAVVLRKPDEVLTKAPVKKIVTSIKESLDGDADSGNLKAVTDEGKVNVTVNSTLYTTNSIGEALESKYLAAPTGATEVSTPLYLSPSTKSQTENIVIRAKRLNTMQEVTGILLEDKLKNKVFDLSSGDDYATTVNAADNHDRFVLRFKLSPMGIEDEIGGTEKNINSYYANGELTVSGFEDEDMGSIISVYDIQGRMLRQAKVNELTMRISEVFYPGAYIVKVVGNKSYVSKFLVR